MATRTINIALVEQTPQERTLAFYPTLASVEEGVLLEEKYEVTTDDEGVGTIDLPTLEGGSLHYDLELPGSFGTTRARLYVPDGDAPVDLGELLALSGGITDNIAAYIGVVVANHASVKANEDTLGHVKVDGTTITVDENGVISAAGGGSLDSVLVQDEGVILDGSDYFPITLAVKNAVGKIDLGGSSGNTAVNGDTLTVNGQTWTFVNSGAAAMEINVGATPEDQWDNIVAALFAELTGPTAVVTSPDLKPGFVAITSPGAAGNSIGLSSTGGNLALVPFIGGRDAGQYKLSFTDLQYALGLI